MVAYSTDAGRSVMAGGMTPQHGTMAACGKRPSRYESSDV
jgi:hypothetical protein